MVAWARVVVIVLVSLAATGCAIVAGAAAGGAAVGVVAGRAVAGQDAGAGSAVAVTFDPSRDLVAVGRMPGDTVRVRGAVSLVGRVTVERGDTLRVMLSEARGSDGPATFPARRQPVTSIVRGEGVSVRVINRRPALTDGMFVGALVGATAAFLALVVYCSTTRCLD